MGNYQKFMFDNFVIEDDEEDEAPVHSEIIEEVEAEKETVIEPENMVEVPAPVPVIQGISQKELDQAVLKAEQAGYEKGFQSAEAAVDKEVAEILGNIDTKLLDLVVNGTEFQKQMEKQFLKLNCAVLKKIIPSVLEDQCEVIVGKFLEEHFPNFRNEAKISFYLNPEVIGKVQEKIAQLAHTYDFEGKIALHKDKSLERADCRVEWENGGVEHLSNKLLEKVDNLLEEDHAEK